MGIFLSRAIDNSADNEERTVTVNTGDRKGKGRNGELYISLINKEQIKTEPKKLQISYWNYELLAKHFEGGSKHEICIPGIPKNFGRVVKVELLLEVKGVCKEWFLDWIKVTNGSNEKDSIFPIHRWIKPGVSLLVAEFDVFLPQYDDNAKTRKEELAEKKILYSADTKIKHWPLPQVKNLPESEKFSFAYKFKLKSKLIWGLIALKILNIFGDVFGKVKSYRDILFFYKLTFKVPDAAQGDAWKTDEAFGRQRLCGCNSSVIRLCRAIPDNFAVHKDMLKPFLEGSSLEEALSDKRLYIVDYKVSEDITCGGNRQICSPIGLFFVNAKKQLVPIAIQLFQVRSEYFNPIFLPSDEEHTWLLAKMWFNNADASFHQSCTHLGFTHLLMEPICLATHQSLSPSHPVFRLLAPHFLYLLAINSEAIENLIAPGKWVDKSMSIGYNGMFEIMTNHLGNWRLDVQGSLPKDLEERGVDDDEALPHYYYRHDGLLYYDAIQKYVREVVSIFYQSQKDVKDDYEIQEWARCLSAPVNEGGVGIPGVHGGGKFKSTEEIVDLCTSIIFIASVGHAAANFSQYEDYGFPPNYPGFLRGSPPMGKKRPRTEADVNEAIPPKSVIINTMVITRALSMKATNQLGNFEVKYLFDDGSQSAANKFREELKTIGKRIKNRNDNTSDVYNFLLPDEVPNAISI